MKPSNNRFKLTTTSVRQRCKPPEPGAVNGNGKPVSRLFYWDTDLRGFALVASRTTRTFILQKDLLGTSKRVTVGRYPAWTPDAARKRAMELTVQMDMGVDPNKEAREAKANGTTLDEAIEWHQTAMKAKRCAPRSIATIREEAERHLSDWLRRPLASIGRNECARRHERITEARGPYAANRALHHFRAVYNTAMRRLEDLPPCPTVAVTFNRSRRRREPISWADLPTWSERVDSIANPIRRDLQRLLLFTGLRSTDAKTIRWEHVDFDAKTLHRPKPKGGVDRAFTVPISDAVIAILRRRQDENPLMYPDDGGWVFPSTNMHGQVTHVAQVKEQRYDDVGRKMNFLPSPHRLRDTFASAAHEARIHPLDLKVLMNHTLPAGDVTEGYIRRGCTVLSVNAPRRRGARFA